MRGQVGFIKRADRGSGLVSWASCTLLPGLTGAQGGVIEVGGGTAPDSEFLTSEDGGFQGWGGLIGSLNCILHIMRSNIAQVRLQE